MKRFILIGGLVVVLAIAGVVLYSLSQLDGLVADAIETYGSEIAGVPVRVGAVSIQLAEGRGSITGLTVANPEGYTPGDAFSLGEITLDIDPASVTGSPIVIDEILIAAPVALYELNGQGVANFDVIRDNIDRYGASGGEEGGGGGQGASEEESPLRIRVTAFRFEKGRVTADLSKLNDALEAQTLDLPAVRLEDVGGKEGVTPEELGEKVLKTFAKSVRRASKDLVKKHLGKAGEVLEKLGEDAGNLLNKLF